MKLKRFMSLALVLTMFLALMPLQADAAVKGTVTIKDMSGDFLSGYYVIYEYGGTELRSDMLGENVNYDLWNMLSAQDKKDVMTNYAFGPGWMTKQFGSENVKKMNAWWNDVTGWAGAKKVLQDRIAKREFPRAAAAFSGSFTDKVAVELPDVEHKPTAAYAFLPEVKEYLDNELELQLTWNVGVRSYNILKSTKTSQVSAAVTSLSGDLISLIVERALVPGITPGGLSALAPNLTGELLSIADKITGISDKIIEKGAGKRLSASDARKIIDQCWEIINLNEQYCDQCINHFVSCKGRRASLYSDAADAVSAYIEENGTMAQASEEQMKTFAEAADATAVPMEFETREAFDAAWNTFKSTYNTWYSAAAKKVDELAGRKSQLQSDAMSYSKWPGGGIAPDKMQTLDLTSMYTPSGVAVCSVNGERRYAFPVLLAGMDDAFTGAMQEADDDIDKLETYIDDYNAELEAMASRWAELKGEWMGYKAAAQTFGRTIDEIPTDRIELYIFKDMYNRCGHWGDDSLDNALKKLNDYRDSLDDRESEWNEQSEALKRDLLARYNAIAALQARHDILAAEATKLAQQISDIINRSDAKFYNGYGEINDEALKQQLEDASPWTQAGGDFTAFQALYDELGAELTEMWNEYTKAHDKWLQDQLEMEELEAEYKAQLGSKNTTYNTFQDNGECRLMLAELGGGTLKNLDEMQDAHLTAGWRKDDGWNNTYLANPSEGQVLYNFDAGNFKKSYAEFTGQNGANAEAAIFYDQLNEYKANYIRDPSRRTSIRNTVLDHLYSNVNRATNFTQYTRNFYSKGSAGNQAQVDKVLNSWAALAGTYKPVTGLTRSAKLMADGADLTLVPGETYDLSRHVSVTPSNATDKTLIWDSSAYSVCWVSENGMLTAMNPGEATITAAAADSGWKYSGGVKVYDPAPITFTVRVGAGTEASGSDNSGIVPLQTFGGAPYDVTENGDGTVTVSLGVGLLEEHQSAAAALYSRDGLLYGLRYLTPAAFESQPAAFTAPAAEGLVLKLFAIDTANGFVPMAEPILETTIK